MYRYRKYKYIDQCKDTYCKGREWYHAYRYKLKERMPNIAGIYGVSFGSETECSVASASNVFLNWP
jgi:hypothetical protein